MSSIGGKGAKKAVKFLNVAKSGNNKCLCCWLIIFFILLAKMSATNAECQQQLDELREELAKKTAEFGKKMDEKEKELKQIHDLLQFYMNLMNGTAGSIGTPDAAPSWLSIASNFSPDLLAIFICVVISIFAWRTSDISSLRSDISSLRDRIHDMDTAKAKTTDISALRSDISALRDQIHDMDTAKAKTTDMENLRNQMTDSREKCAKLEGQFKMIVPFIGMEKKVLIRIAAIEASLGMLSSSSAFSSGNSPIDPA